MAYKILNGILSPTFLPNAQEFLQLSKDVRCGYWFIFEEHAESRLYGASSSPYRLPKFVPMRLFALEFIRQSLKVDQVHFVPMKKCYFFKLRKAMGPFIVNTRQVAQEVERLLNDMCLLQVVEWAYDAHQIISKRRLENGYSTFVHESRLETEKLANGGLQNIQGIELETPRIIENGVKRIREKVIDLDEKEFEVEKRTKL